MFKDLLGVSPLRLERNVAKLPFIEILQTIHETEVIGAMLLCEIERITQDLWPQQPIRWKSKTAHELTYVYEACSLRAERLFQSKIENSLFANKPNEGTLYDQKIVYYLRHKQTEEIVYQPAGFGNLVNSAVSDGFSYTPFTTEWYIRESGKHRELGVVQIQHPDIEDVRPISIIRQGSITIFGDHIAYSLISVKEKNPYIQSRSDALRTTAMFWD